MFNDCTNHNITFGSVNIDSRWATNFNTFIFDPTTFPNIRNMLDDFQAKNKHILKILDILKA
jgi:alpha-glucosidase (family GH31 glycosyl hydrolase)